jgi:two-component sensor histidine kinase
VQAVARQTAAGEPEHFVESFTERVQALAANHDLLIESRWQGAGFSARPARALCRPGWFPHYGPRSEIAHWLA